MTDWPGQTVFGLDFGNHLWVVLNAPADAMVVAANLTTHGRSRLCSGNCVTIEPGEHPFVARVSCLFFRQAMFVSSGRLEEDRDRRTLQQHVPFSAELLLRVQLGALESRLVTPAAKAAIRRSLPPGWAPAGA